MMHSMDKEVNQMTVSRVEVEELVHVLREMRSTDADETAVKDRLHELQMMDSKQKLKDLKRGLKQNEQVVTLLQKKVAQKLNQEEQQEVVQSIEKMLSRNK